MRACIRPVGHLEFSQARALIEEGSAGGFPLAGFASPRHPALAAWGFGEERSCPDPRVPFHGAPTEAPDAEFPHDPARNWREHWHLPHR